ncbi:MAG: ABC-F family ATP-binding cassette domain-containing protein [Oscillochloris sp.]|nr:ABC-F family ATP-binding cassette domain-containing protein [Oscillochloris sp.]
MLQAHGLCKAYGAATILKDITFHINDGEHVGLIGPNGAGKSTLLRLLIGAEPPDSGTIVLSSGAKIGYLAQQFAAQIGATIDDAIAHAQAEWSAAAAELQQSSDALAATDNLDAALVRYDAALARFELLGGYEREHRAAAILEGLELPAPTTPIDILSGGQKTRLGLAMLLLGEPDLLLLDEPTNHLDVAALEWLEGFVQQYPRAALIVSHDRTFLDRTVGRVLVLDADTRSMRSYTGGYSDYLVARDQERAAQQVAWQDQQAYITRVQADVARMKQGASKLDQAKTPVGDHDMKWILSGSQAVGAKLARMAKARERKLERYRNSDERVERPRHSWSMKLDFGARRAAGGRYWSWKTCVSPIPAVLSYCAICASKCNMVSALQLLGQTAPGKAPCCG